MVSYQRVDVRFEHALGGETTRRVNRAVLTVYGSSELAVLAELQRQHPEYKDVTILDVTVL